MSELIAKHSDNGTLDGELLVRLHREFNEPAPGGKYRHWHKLQFLKPPPDLDHELWWLAIKLARGTILKSWPLMDVNGRQFRIAMPDVLLEKVHLIDRRASGSLAGQDFLPSDRQRRAFLMRSLHEEAITSSQLEGAATTRKVAKRMLREGLAPRDKSEQMILNNYHGMRFITEQAKDRPLDQDLIFELHGILTEDTLDVPEAVGRFRRDDEDIAVVDESGGILHDPPRAEELPDRMTAMCRFANDESLGSFVHPVVRSILLHFWLAYDHPFVDGNGRTARALFYWSMAHHGYWLIEFTSISRLLLRARARYNRAFLYTESDENDATYFVLHQCQTVLQAIRELHEYIGRKMDYARRSRQFLRDGGAMDLGLNHRQLALLRYAIGHPGTQFSIKAHQLYHNVSYQTARTDLLGIADLELLIVSKIRNRFVFVAPDDLRQRLESCGGEA